MPLLFLSLVTMLRYSIVVAILVALVVMGIACMHPAAHSEKLPEQVSYNFHVRPILSDKCFKCHGPDANHQEAGLRLDNPQGGYAALRETKGAFAIVPGFPDSSELYKRITSTDPGYQMPTPESHLGLLTATETGLIRKWIEQGAKYERHWAFTAPVKAPLPTPENATWAKNEIDYFVLQKLQNKGLSPNEEADPATLLKRVTLDLTGLPPTLDAMDKFAADPSAANYEKQVDALLATPQYGEKMAVHWLDVARYADSYGYQDDNIRTQWAWRDWVIHAYNENMPYDQFLTWQIAGDLLPEATKEQVLATAFFRNHKYTEEGGVIPEEYRVEYILDKTKTYSKGILGLTVECAQCHDHKYDPISQKDYFQLFAFFNNLNENGYEGDVSISKPAKNPVLTLTQEDIQHTLQFINVKDTARMFVSVMGDLDTLRKTYILNRGVYDQHGDIVRPAALPAVMKYDSADLPQNRLGLARWTVDRSNPLTARVFVNQIWQEIFGKGIVKTAGDFGMQGDLPTHPELLDWLAVDFMEHGWNIKRLVKQMVMSATYRQSAVMTKEKINVDPDNAYYSHAPRVRLSAESIRDLVLASSGLLVKEIGGPSVKPYQPKGLWESATSGRGVLATYIQDKGDDLYRRGIYTFIKLTSPPPSMILFDASNRDQCEVKRLPTNTPLQALAMMNDPTVLEASRVFAQRLLEANADAHTNLDKAFRQILCRPMTEKEKKLVQDYYQQQLQAFEKGSLDAQKTLAVGEYPGDDKLPKPAFAALMKTINLLYNMEETIVKS